MGIDAKVYHTSDIKLAAFLLAEVSTSKFTVVDQKDSYQKIIQIFYPELQQKLFKSLIDDYANKRAKVSLYAYNRKINILRDILKGGVV